MKPVRLCENVFWVGGVDWRLRNFHGYLTHRGSTYNAYLIVDEKITLIDTVKHYLADEMMERIAAVVDPAKIDIVVSNHVEMDHSGSLPVILSKAPKATLITSPNGHKGLQAHFRSDWPFRVVQSGDTLSLGQNTLAFVTVPMVHWPDSMVTYLPEKRVLFSNDAFGQHIASSERFNNEIPKEILFEEARKYYANIVLPYGNQVKKALEALGGLDLDLIAPSHGVMWRTDLPELLEAYTRWAGNRTENRAVIVYDTMWDSTGQIAQAIAAGFESCAIPFAVHNLKDTHISDVMTELIRCKYICVGSPTLNNGMLPTVAAFLTYMKGLAPKSRTGLAFGSYGWGGQSIGQIKGILADCGFAPMESVRIQYRPAQSDLDRVTKQVAEEVQSTTGHTKEN